MRRAKPEVDRLTLWPASRYGLINAPTAEAPGPSSAVTAAWPRPSDEAAVHFFTDGAVARALDSAVVIHSVFEEAPNVAIVAFGVAPALPAGSGADAYLEVANYSRAAQDVRVQLTRGSQTVLDKTLSIEAGQALRTTTVLDGSGAPDVHARVSARANALG